MGPGQLIALVLAAYLLQHKVTSEDLTKDSKKQKKEHLLLINEVNADNPKEDTWEYVELYHTSGHQVRLDGYHVVFYNGNGNQAYRVQKLQGLSTDDRGFLLLGSSTVVPKPAVILPKNTIQNGPDAIALYLGKGSFYEGMSVTNESLVDALVHKSKKSDRADTLVSVLTPDTEPFLEDPFFRTTDESLERCQGVDSRWFFQTGVPTPGSDNHCIPFSQLNASSVLINEVNLVSSPEEFEFVELQGPPSTELKDLVLVLVEGQTQEIYFAMEVRGKTSPDGLLLIGAAQAKISVDLQFPPNHSGPLLRAGANAIALYVGKSSGFVPGAAASTTDLLDALVYTTTENASSELRGILTPGRPAFYMKERSQPGNTSVSRCVCCSVSRDPSVYALGDPTPGQFNDCPKKRYSQEIFMCLQVTGCQQVSPELQIQEFLARVLDKPCNCGVSPAFFKNPAVTCHGTELVFTSLLTARSKDQLSSLLQTFSVLLESKEVMDFGGWNSTVARNCSVNMTETPPGPTPEKPRTTKEPLPQIELLINEVNPDNPGAREDTEYIELFYPGPAPFDLHGYWLVLYNGKNSLAYKVVNLTGQRTNEQGYFLVGSTGVTPKPSLILPDNTIQNGVDAVALYRSTTEAYRINMPVTEEGLVDAVVYKSRGSDKADKLLAVLTPGQSILHEDDSLSIHDESLSRCHSLKPRNHNSFQVTEITPFRANACPALDSNSTEETAHNHSVAINELGLAGGTVPFQFIELKGKPSASLKGYELRLFSGDDARSYARIPLQGTFGSNGLFVVLPAGRSRPSQAHEQLVMSSLWSRFSAQPVPQAVAVFSPRVQFPDDAQAMEDTLEDAVAYTWEAGTRQVYFGPLGPVHFVAKRGERRISLSRCSSCSTTYVVSDPTPGWENKCPKESLSLDLRMCLMTTDCSLGSPISLTLGSLQRALAESMEKSCSCGICPCYLHGLNFTCFNSTLKLSGQVWARSPEQRQLLTKWQENFSASSHPFAVDGRLFRTNAVCPSPLHKPLRTEASFQSWVVALIILGSISVALMLIGVGFYCIKRRPQHYTTIEMNDRCEILADS
ncbi:uncharacterized protein [Tiliqua scincoides]|uniref:uncharacterized protein n=1 Tax=Tiliqua scincoides TaxID=71010 RepID=UPI003461BE04